MRYFLGMILASAVLIGQPDPAQAQFSISIGNPYLGNGVAIGNPGYGYGYNSYSNYGFGNSFSNYGYGNGVYGAPVYASPYVGRSYGYSSGYGGYSPVVRPAVPYYGGYRNNGYRGNGGYRSNGFRNFGGYRR